ncbi:hypothetical protein [Streptomyces sp. AC627_RSS907]|uniref:hypothetical protein n=1 Tax=Streptomyces sp. AC627_RSS907 TaxID=2823684 RepID=UPI001C2175EB|nr:hypothetical protein [Streptomyces sp. AC627_RSS907]
MTHDRHEPDGTAAGVFLAAQAAVLEARAHLLRAALDTVDARMRETSEKLRRLRLSFPAPEADEAGRVRGEEYASTKDVRA